MSIELMMLPNDLIFCCPLLLLSIFPSIMVFSNASAFHIRWPKYWSFNFNISLPMNSQGWFPLRLNSLISLLSKRLSRLFSSITIESIIFFFFWCSGIFMVQLSHSYITSGKIIALTTWTFVDSDISAFYTDSILLPVIAILIFYTSSWFSLQRLYISRNLSIFSWVSILLAYNCS